MNKIAVNYGGSLRHKVAKVKAWRETTHASKELQVHILKEWRMGTLALLIPRDKFMKIVKET